ncbi:TetR/AcrR family transcriptional regulator [Rhizobium sp. TRM95111]|uniref:TetR/AcrR family transcriptional regulator n=1 Tax=Rhizobium alarense TaxID=2846851 RepID=UPI001F30C90A|nr:TetR/AcrR family transcriptional regulator [Rhizobium alarense]MCF3642687.1 TetR/AcrR family transcriptional regulator [Rhizobium alarense]
MPRKPIAVEKRQDIIETAYALFRREGFHATGIDRIIAEAEVAKMTMYRHFPGKEDLIVAVLNWRHHRFEEQLDRLLEGIATTAGKIAGIIDWHARWFARPDFCGCLFQHALAEYGDPGHPVFVAVVRQKQDMRRRMREILVEDMPAERAESVASVLAMLLEGATLAAQMGKGEDAIRQARDAAAALMGIGRARQ